MMGVSAVDGGRVVVVEVVEGLLPPDAVEVLLVEELGPQIRRVHDMRVGVENLEPSFIAAPYAAVELADAGQYHQRGRGHPYERDAASRLLKHPTKCPVSGRAARRSEQERTSSEVCDQSIQAQRTERTSSEVCDQNVYERPWRRRRPAMVSVWLSWSMVS